MCIYIYIYITYVVYMGVLQLDLHGLRGDALAAGGLSKGPLR